MPPVYCKLPSLLGVSNAFRAMGAESVGVAAAWTLLRILGVGAAVHLRNIARFLSGGLA